MSLRDPEFCESLEGFYATAVLESEPKLPHHLVSCTFCPCRHRTYTMTAYARSHHAVSHCELN